jgi:hypothetical protein
MPANPQSIQLTDQYAARLRRLSVVTGEDLAAGWKQLSLDSAAIKRFLRRAETRIAIAQDESIKQSTAYVEQYLRSETRGKILENLHPQTAAGTTTDGRDLGTALAATPAKVYAMAKVGKPIAVAMAFGAFSLARFARTEISDAGRTEVRTQVVIRDEMVGWRWINHGMGCPACLAQSDGAIRSPDHPMNPHASCDCSSEPVVAGVHETITRPTGQQQLQALPFDQQAAILGGKDYAEALNNGNVSLADFAETKSSHQWRDSIIATHPEIH